MASEQREFLWKRSKEKEKKKGNRAYIYGDYAEIYHKNRMLQGAIFSIK
jgi:hypothetical protein